jgi:predicted kinase
LKIESKVIRNKTRLITQRRNQQEHIYYVVNFKKEKDIDRDHGASLDL